MFCETCGEPLPEAARFCSACGRPAAREPQLDRLREALQRVLPKNLRVVRPLGKGGMGTVYLAVDDSLEREVAIKTLASESGTDDELRRRFRREAKIAAALHHPHIVPLYSFGEGAELLYYVMGFVRGETLAQRLDRERTVAPEESRRILLEIAEALAYASSQSVIHRDVKPENILIEDGNATAYLADFGIARTAVSNSGLTTTGAIVGTPSYMSPEQAFGKTIDHRSDIYSLGVVGYRILTGRFPLSGENFAELLAKHASERPEPVDRIDPAISPDLASAVMRCLEKNPNDRWSSAVELIEALRGTGPEPAEDEANVQSVGFYLLMLVWLAALMVPYEVFFWTVVEPGWRVFIQAVQAVPLLAAGVYAIRMRSAYRAGAPWSTILRSFFHPPKWYWGWIPRRLRTRGDLWARLPATVRLYRTMFLGMVLAASVLAVAAPMLVIGPEWISETGMEFFIAPWLLIIISTSLTGVMAKRSLKKLGAGRREIDALMNQATWRLTPDRTPSIAKLLQPEVADRENSAVPAGPQIATIAEEELRPTAVLPNAETRPAGR